ncbi:MAG: DUF2807 domain-containing protein [Alistipes sp.]|jgi:hypothetical protein|nr:DUF2807 domain-containing protein [Alistipes sp.]
MKKLLFVLSAVALFATSCAAQPFIRVKGSGKSVKGEFDITLDYSSLSVQEGIEVVLVPSDVPLGTIVADEEVMEYVSIVETNGVVKVSYEPTITISSGGVKTVVTMPISGNLARVKVSSAGSIKCETTLNPTRLEVDASSAGMVDLSLDGGNLSADLSSAATVNIRGNVGLVDVEASSAATFDINGTVGLLNVDLSSAATFRGEGTADQINLEVSSAASFRGYDLTGRSAVVDASSGGSVHFTVTDELDAEASSGASVKYMGSPTRVNRDVSSGGSVRKAE